MNGVEFGYEMVLPKQSINTETTKEEIIACVKGFVDKICSLLNLHIIEELTREHEYGAFYYLGIIGSQHPIICIGNSTHATYYRSHIAVTYITSEGLPSCGLAFTPNSMGGIIISITGTYDCYLKFIKTNDVTAFAVNSGNVSDNNINMSFYISKAVNGMLEANILLVNNSDKLYYSYEAKLGEKYRISICSKSAFEMLAPSDKDVICNVFIGNFMIDKIKVFTNKTMMTAGTIFMINEKKYIILNYISGYMTLICELPQDEQTQ